MSKLIDPLAGASEADARAEQIALPRVDESGATPQPDSVAKLWVVPEYDELTLEQHDLHQATAEEVAREAKVEAAGLAPAAAAASLLVEGHTPLLRAAETRYIDAHDALASFRRRPPNAKKWHYLTKAGLLVGDVTTLAGSFIWLGEEPILAAVMAISAAVATVTAGLSGAEVRDIRNRERRARTPEQLTEKQQPFAHLFEAPDKGWRFVKGLTWVSVSVAGTIATGIFALRSTLEDPLVGLVFGGIAAAIAGASWIEAYVNADEISDALDLANADYQRVVARHKSLAASSSWQRREEALTTGTSLHAEHTHRAAAAGHHLQALLSGILRRNPQTAGNGPAAETTSIGQTTRRSGGAK
ncbi:hypothetical protein [uncultured Microbacterium sp.]|uniref:hypothetical protein n=1 Tax=uncultured Microbacterium sp. TaxID=191216 RepID=UPI0035CBA2C8